MRISDWSSDVCSSDLVARCRGLDDPGQQQCAFQVWLQAGEIRLANPTAETDLSNGGALEGFQQPTYLWQIEPVVLGAGYRRGVAEAVQRGDIDRAVLRTAGVARDSRNGAAAGDQAELRLNLHHPPAAGRCPAWKHCG